MENKRKNNGYSFVSGTTTAQGPFNERQMSNHDELSKTIRRVFYSLIGTCLFCVITLAGTPDKALLGQSGQVKLPVLSYEINFTAFLIIGPVLLIALNLYLHLFMSQLRSVNIPPSARLPMLPNFESLPARIIAESTLNLLVPSTLLFFTWKAWPLKWHGYTIASIAIILCLRFLWLQIKKLPPSFRYRDWAIAHLIAGLGIAIYCSGILLHDRKLYLYKEELKELDMESVSLVGADMRRADLAHTNLTNANLTNANLTKANLAKANLTNADLAHTNLTNANLTKANLTKANLYTANLAKANLTNADLTNTSLINVNFSNANLSFANLSNVKHASQYQFDDACGNKETKLPDGLIIKICENESN